MTDALTKAKEAAGSAMALAQRLGITPQAIYQWRQVPADKAIAVERLTGVSRHDLRPDVFGPAPHDDFVSHQGRAAS